MTTLPHELDLRFRAAAAEGGLLDVAYDLVESPIGQLLVGVSAHGVCRIAFDPEPEAELERLARRLGPRVLRTGRRVEPIRRQLGEYFEGRRAEFELAYDLTGIAPFQQEVLRELVRVPYSETSTYGALAQRVGRPRAARAVGGALNRNPIPIVVPCHRIVGSTGSLVGYAGGLERKRALLELEGALLL